MVWSWVAGSYNVKEIRAVREIGAGEELCANYIDSFEVRERERELNMSSIDAFRAPCHLAARDRKN